MTEDVNTEPEETGVVDAVRRSIAEIRDSATVERVYGEPVRAEGRTLLPVARVAYGFGSGGEDGSGGGGGGGVAAQPVGVVEISEDGTRFVRVADWKRPAVAAAVGLVLGYLLGQR